MTEACDQDSEQYVLAFRDRLLAGELETEEELEAKGQLEEMAAYLAKSHLALRDGIAGIDFGAASAQYVRLSSNDEFALELYWASAWAANPPAWFHNWISKHPIDEAAFDILKFVLKKYEHEKMSDAEYNKLIQAVPIPGLVGSDGTIFSREKYGQLDDGWIIAVFNYILNLVHHHDIHKFGEPLTTVATMSAKDGTSDPTIGIIGDWGGGRYQEDGANGKVPSPAERVLADVSKQPLDYLIHLGDVYYAGTDGKVRFDAQSASEEQDNLVELWPDQGTGRNYTLNSNHEMYGAAQGYFQTALNNPKPLFHHQQGSSFFALRYPLDPNAGKGDSWLVLGLDSAYFSDTKNGPKMYMEGAIGADKLFSQDDKKQIKAIEQVCTGHSGPIMVMTHHNPCDTITTQTNVLYDQVVKAIGRAPTMWIWGHVHNCIVYNQMVIEADKQGPVISSITKSRCCGHGAVPFGPAWGLEKAQLPYVASTHDDAFPAGNPRVYNGYGTVTLHQDGGFTERYYEVRLPGQPGVEAWSKTWTGSELVADSCD